MFETQTEEETAIQEAAEEMGKLAETLSDEVNAASVPGMRIQRNEIQTATSLEEQNEAWEKSQRELNVDRFVISALPFAALLVIGYVDAWLSLDSVGNDPFDTWRSLPLYTQMLPFIVATSVSFILGACARRYQHSTLNDVVLERSKWKPFKITEASTPLEATNCYLLSLMAIAERNGHMMIHNSLEPVHINTMKLMWIAEELVKQKTEATEQVLAWGIIGRDVSKWKTKLEDITDNRAIIDEHTATLNVQIMSVKALINVTARENVILSDTELKSAIRHLCDNSNMFMDAMTHAVSKVS